MTPRNAGATLPPARAARRAAKKTRRGLAKTNVKAPSTLGFGLISEAGSAKSAVSLLYLFQNCVIFRNPCPDWVCAALS
ncbi:MAG: hypothetical protein PPHERAN_2927 [uncultured Paraburkholderia sp.]|nr:MAG: hypothetical protein PPHERAN_2927 [uncultured Paraburkholderia sp.]